MHIHRHIHFSPYQIVFTSFQIQTILVRITLYYSAITSKSLNFKGIIAKVYLLFTSESDVALVALYPAYLQVLIQRLRLFPFYNSTSESFTSAAQARESEENTHVSLTTRDWKQRITSIHFPIVHNSVIWANITPMKVGKRNLPVYSRSRDGWVRISPVSALKLQKLCL